MAPAAERDGTARTRGVLLDVDGTLVDSVDAHTRAWVAALTEAGHEVTHDRVRPLIGMGGDRVLPTLTGLAEDSDVGKRIAARRAQLFLEREAPALRPTAGAEEFLHALRSGGGRIGIATSAKPDELQMLLQVVHATDLLDGAASADEVDASKPAPDVIEAALDRVGLAPGEVVLVGDTSYDIESAANAGVATVALRSGGWADPDLAGAVAIYDDPGDLLAHAAASPLAGLLGRHRERGAGAG